MRKTALLAVIGTLIAHDALAHVVRHSEIPEAFRGTWGLSSSACKQQDKSVVVLAAKTYVSSAGTCTVMAVSETPAKNGALYSARLQCSGQGGVPKVKTMNVLFREQGADQISLGAKFRFLKPYQRCAAN